MAQRPHYLVSIFCWFSQPTYNAEHDEANMEMYWHKVYGQGVSRTMGSRNSLGIALWPESRTSVRAGSAASSVGTPFTCAARSPQMGQASHAPCLLPLTRFIGFFTSLALNTAGAAGPEPLNSPCLDAGPAVIRLASTGRIFWTNPSSRNACVRDHTYRRVPKGTTRMTKSGISGMPMLCVLASRAPISRE